MRCEDATDLIIDSIMDSLDEEQARDLATHLASCDACALEARRLREVWTALGALEVPAGGRRGHVDRVGMRPVSVGGKPTGGRWSTGRLAASLALLLVGGAVGYVAGGASASPGASAHPGAIPHAAAQAEGSAFLLLVRGEEPDAQVRSEVLMEEYGTWAMELARDGRLLAGEKLADEPGRWISGASVEDTRERSDVSGYFVVRAPSYDEAISLAMESPHVRYGGVFEVRQIDEGP